MRKLFLLPLRGVSKLDDLRTDFRPLLGALRKVYETGLACAFLQNLSNEAFEHFPFAVLVEG